MSKIDDILNNTNTQFTVSNNPDPKPNYASHYALDFAGRIAVSAYVSDIDRLSAKYGVDPHLVKSIMYVENAQGNYGGLTYLADSLGFSRTIMPMNINPNIWGGLVGSDANFNSAQTNIEAGVILISRIQNHLAPTDRTIAKIATLYNSTDQTKVTNYGARVEQVYSSLSFESNYDDLHLEKYISTASALDQLKFVKEGEYAFVNNDSGGKYLFKIVNGVPTIVDPNCNLDASNPNLEIIKSLPAGSRVNFIGSGDVKNSASVTDALKYSISSGDTLSQIAQNYDVSVDYLLSINPSITNPNQIQAGQAINVPASAVIYKTYNGDQTYVFNSSGLLKEEAKFFNKDGEEVSQSDAIIKLENTELGKLSVIRTDLTVTLRDNTTTTLDTVLNTIDTSSKAFDNFIGSGFSSITKKLFGVESNAQGLAAEIALSLATGQNLEEIATKIALREILISPSFDKIAIYSNVDTRIGEELSLGYNDLMQYQDEQTNPNSTCSGSTPAASRVCAVTAHLVSATINDLFADEKVIANDNFFTVQRDQSAARNYFINPNKIKI